MTGAEICCVRMLRPLLESEPCEFRARAPLIHAPTEPPECVDGTLLARAWPCFLRLYRRATKTIDAPHSTPPAAIGMAMAAADLDMGDELLESPPNGAPPPWEPGEMVAEFDDPVAVAASIGWPASRGIEGTMRLISVAIVGFGLE